MQVLDDMELVREFAATKSEQAFAAIVQRHINLVYSVALRHAGNAHEAQDITQSVFVVLAKKAASLRQGTVLSGWLFQAARMTASNFLRTEARRMHREQEAYMQSTLKEGEDRDAWAKVAPLLDAAIADLGEKDRNAIVLRYVEGKDLKEVGAALRGDPEDAAKKRVSRAVEKLRGFFTRNSGVVLSGAALAGVISANALQAAPAGMAAVNHRRERNTRGAGTTVTLVGISERSIETYGMDKSENRGWGRYGGIGGVSMAPEQQSRRNRLRCIAAGFEGRGRHGGEAAGGHRQIETGKAGDGGRKSPGREGSAAIARAPTDGLQRDRGEERRGGKRRGEKQFIGRRVERDDG